MGTQHIIISLHFSQSSHLLYHIICAHTCILHQSVHSSCSYCIWYQYRLQVPVVYRYTVHLYLLAALFNLVKFFSFPKPSHFHPHVHTQLLLPSLLYFFYCSFSSSNLLSSSSCVCTKRKNVAVCLEINLANAL